MKTIYVVIAWFGLALIFSLMGTFDAGNHPPVALVAALLLPILCYLIDRTYLKGALFGDLYKLNNPTIIFLQSYRVLGVVFLIQFAHSQLPSGFALPAGVGDMTVGVLAPWVAYNLMMHRPDSVRSARWWNYLGLLDLVVALTMGVTHQKSLLGIFAQDISVRAIGQYPLSLIPTWLVPLAVIMHLQSLRLLRREESSTNADLKDMPDAA